jgi:hypothetical protein
MRVAAKLNLKGRLTGNMMPQLKGTMLGRQLWLFMSAVLRLDMCQCEEYATRHDDWLDVIGLAGSCSLLLPVLAFAAPVATHHVGVNARFQNYRIA